MRVVSTLQSWAWRSVVAALIAVILVAAAGPNSATDAKAQGGEDWEILQFRADYTVQRDGTVEVVEHIDVDFRDLPTRGIFRDLVREAPCPEPDAEYPRSFECPEVEQRQWRYTIRDVEYADGSAVPWETSEVDHVYRVRIGDPDITLTGQQRYRLAYTIEGALDAYAETDELYWNAVADWPVRIRDAEVTVRLPGASPVAGACFQGFPGVSEQDCPFDVDSSADDVSATYSSIGMLETGETMTVALEWEKGLVDVGPPITHRPFSVHDLYTLDLIEWLGAALMGVLGLAGLGRTWWRFGRDRRYTTVHYLTDDTAEETRPLFGGHPIVVEYTPPLDLRPGQMGVVQDERANTEDVSATIVDLAVRGFLRVEEIPKSGWFGKTDWKLHRLKPAEEAELLAYEQTLLSSLFQGRDDEVKVSELKDKFAKRLEKVKDQMYEDGTSRGWFAGNPKRITMLWAAVGVGVAVVGVGLAAATGYFLGRILIGAPIAIAGLLLLAISGHMSRRTATGSEVRRRVRGFKLYVETAEKHLQEFNEQEHIFAAYLPYAMVFGCVDKWTKAFEGLENLERNARRSVAPWYVGAGAFNMHQFNRSMSGFAGNVGSTLASTPSSSGGSGVRGGSVGGGGGGGGGGRW